MARFSRRALFRSIDLDVLIYLDLGVQHLSFVDASSDARKSFLIS